MAREERREREGIRDAVCFGKKVYNPNNELCQRDPTVPSAIRVDTERQAEIIHPAGRFRMRRKQAAPSFSRIDFVLRYEKLDR